MGIMGGPRGRRGMKALTVRWFLAAAVAGVVAMPPAGAQAQFGGKPKVNVASPLVKKVQEWDRYTGRFQALKQVDIRARVSGYLESIDFTDGQFVKKGDLLFVIDPRPFQADVAAAKASVESANAELRLAQADLKRGEELLRRRVISPAEVDTRRAKRDVAAAKVSVQKANQRTAELNLSFTNVRAPVAGRLSDRRVDVGNLITGGSATGTLLTTLVANEPIHFVFDVSEGDYLVYARQVAAGALGADPSQPLPVMLHLSDETGWPHRGVLDFIDNELGQQTGTIRLRAQFPNANGFLQPGLFGVIRMPASPPHDAVLIPDRAVVSDQAQKVVMVVDGANKVSMRPVELGPIVEGLRVVRKGLTGKDTIVVDGVQAVRPGMEVQPKKIEVKAEPENAPAQPGDGAPAGKGR